MTVKLVEIGEFVEAVSEFAFKSTRFTDDPSDVPLIKGGKEIVAPIEERVQALIEAIEYTNLPTPPFTPEEKEAVAAEVDTHVWQQAVRGEFAAAA